MSGNIRKISDKVLHTFHTLQGIADVAVYFGIQVPLVSTLQEGKESPDGNQWLLQVIRRNGGKLSSSRLLRCNSVARIFSFSSAACHFRIARKR